MSSRKTNKRDPGSAGPPAETSSPTGHKEIERHQTVEAMGEDATTEPVSPPSQKAAKKGSNREPNPKKTHISPPG